MTLKRAIVIVAFAGILFSGIGGGIGWLLGAFAPEYYRTVFYGGEDPGFDPVQMGTSLGLMQGMIAGIVIAAVVIGLLIWRDSFKTRLDREPDVGYVSAARSRAVFWIVLWCLVLVISVAFCSTVAFVVGGIMGQQQLYQRETFDKLDKLNKILKDNDYPDVQPESGSADLVFLHGSVKDQATYDNLRNELILTFGTETAEEMLQLVELKQE